MGYKDYYSKGYRCPICWQPITNKARFCRSHAKKFKDWLAEIYGKPVKVSRRNGSGSATEKGERRRREILGLLEFDSLSTRELAAELGMTKDGILHHMHLLEGSDMVGRERNGRSVTWRRVRRS